LLDAEEDEAFDRFTRLAARWLRAPVGLVSLVDDHRQFFKSAFGLPEPWASRRETPLSHSFCQYAVSSAEPLVVVDAREHPLLRDNLAVRDLAVISYAGVPLITSNDEVLGALCVVDSVPRQWSADDIVVLRELAALTMTEIELRARVRALKAAEAAAQESRALLHSVIECMPDAVVVVAPDGQYMLANQAARNTRPPAWPAPDSLTGYGMFLPDGQTPMMPATAPSVRALAGETVRDEEFIVRLPGCPEQSLRVNASPIRDRSGAIIGAVSVGRDNTRAKASRGALTRSDAMFRTVMRGLPNCAVLLFDRDFRYLLADGELLLESMGYSSETLVGKTLADVAPRERLQLLKQRYRAALAGYTEDSEVTRDERTFVLTTTPVRDQQGSVIAGMALVYDVTAHKRVEEALRRQTLVFQSTLEHMREGVVMVKPDGKFLVFNRAAKVFFGMNPALPPDLGQLAQVRFYEGDGDAVLSGRDAPLARAIRGEAWSSSGMMARAADAAMPVHLHVTVDPIRDASSTFLGSVTVMHDVTAQKKAERAARDEAARIELLQSVAAAANSAGTPREAFEACLDLVCEFMKWPLGHVYLKSGALLETSGWWHDDDPSRFAAFRDHTAKLEFSEDVGLIGRVLSTGRATWLLDLTGEQNFLRARSVRATGLESGFALPVLVGEEVVAVLEFYSSRREAPDAPLISLMENIGTQLGRVVERDRARKSMEERADEIRSMSIRDELTGLYNRRGFLELARQNLRHIERSHQSALLFFVDLNGMKLINDELGHDEGDRALAETADVLRATFRASDIVARLGGDEFVALLLEAGAEQIDILSNRIQREITMRNAKGDRRYRLSASVGGAVYGSSHPETIEGLLAKADALMYEQKRRRRNGPLLSMPVGPPTDDARE
jgi:diguanylate cyclase (GGDEF)-like protein/PAS domain S-box-containing protein